jgi:hypothetical protein
MPVPPHINDTNGIQKFGPRVRTATPWGRCDSVVPYLVVPRVVFDRKRVEARFPCQRGASHLRVDPVFIGSDS